MKKTIPLLLLASAILGGCVRRYTITTNNGSQIQTHGKPQLKNGAYIYTDSQGRRAMVPAGRVREVAPSSMVSSGPGSRYNSK